MTKKQKNLLLRILAAAALMVILSLIPFQNILPPEIAGPVRFLLFLIPYFTVGYDILRKAVKGIRNRQVFDENFLMAAATVGAMALGEYSEGVAVMLFYQIGELFQSYAVGKSRKNISDLMDIRPDYANLETEDGIEKADPDDVEIGIMIETPAAVLMSDRLAKEVDFFSCGTNDLTQYTLACDRQNADLGRFYNPHHPAVLRALKMVCDNAHKNGVWVGICGELGADLSLTETFLSIGIDELSVSPRSVLPLRQKIRETTVSEVKEKLLSDLLSDENTI